MVLRDYIRFSDAETAAFDKFEDAEEANFAITTAHAGRYRCNFAARAVPRTQFRGVRSEANLEETARNKMAKQSPIYKYGSTIGAISHPTVSVTQQYPAQDVRAGYVTEGKARLTGLRLSLLASDLRRSLSMICQPGEFRHTPFCTRSNGRPSAADQADIPISNGCIGRPPGSYSG